MREKGLNLSRDDRVHGSMLIINELIMNCAWSDEVGVVFSHVERVWSLSGLGGSGHCDVEGMVIIRWMLGGHGVYCKSTNFIHNIHYTDSSFWSSHALHVFIFVPYPRKLNDW